MGGGVFVRFLRGWSCLVVFARFPMILVVFFGFRTFPAGPGDGRTGEPTPPEHKPGCLQCSQQGLSVFSGRGGRGVGQEISDFGAASQLNPAPGGGLGKAPTGAPLDLHLSPVDQF